MWISEETEQKWEEISVSWNNKMVVMDETYLSKFLSNNKEMFEQTFLKENHMQLWEQGLDLFLGRVYDFLKHLTFFWNSSFKLPNEVIMIPWG